MPYILTFTTDNKNSQRFIIELGDVVSFLENNPGVTVMMEPIRCYFDKFSDVN